MVKRKMERVHHFLKPSMKESEMAGLGGWEKETELQNCWKPLADMRLMKAWD